MSHVVQNDVHSLGQRVSISSSLSLKDKLAIMLFAVIVNGVSVVPLQKHFI